MSELKKKKKLYGMMIVRIDRGEAETKYEQSESHINEFIPSTAKYIRFLLKKGD